MKNDELNQISYKPRAIDYGEYFSAMNLTKAQQEERVALSDNLEEMFFFFLALVSTYGGVTEQNIALIKAQLTNRYQQEIAQIMDLDDYLIEYTNRYAEEVARSTQENADNPWYTSDDRARFNAENEANTVLNYSDYRKAKENGYTKKTWHTFLDKRTRKTHEIINGKTIPIDDLFMVGDSQMRFPKDYEKAEDYPEETINCRCSVSYKK